MGAAGDEQAKLLRALFEIGDIDLAILAVMLSA
jgi:hypothetical protein